MPPLEARLTQLFNLNPGPEPKFSFRNACLGFQFRAYRAYTFGSRRLGVLDTIRDHGSTSLSSDSRDRRPGRDTVALHIAQQRGYSGAPQITIIDI